MKRKRERLITSFLKREQPKPVIQVCSRLVTAKKATTSVKKENLPPPTEKKAIPQRHFGKPPQPAATTTSTKTQVGRNSLRPERTRTVIAKPIMAPAGAGIVPKRNPATRQPAVILKRVRPKDVVIISDSSSSDGDMIEVSDSPSPPKKLCVSVSTKASHHAAADGDRTRMSIPISHDVHLVEPTDWSRVPVWMKDPTDDEAESTDSDNSFVSVNLHRRPSQFKNEKLNDSLCKHSSPTPTLSCHQYYSPSPTPSFSLSDPVIPCPVTCSPPNKQFLTLTVEDSGSPSLSEKSTPLFCSAWPYLHDLQLILEVRGLGSIAGRNQVCCA